MNNQIVLVLVILGITALCMARDPLSSMLSNEAYVRKGINCILNNGPCDVVGRQIKKMLPEALNNNCRRCTPYQARSARRLIQFMRTRYLSEWNQIVKRYSIRGYY